MTLPGLPEGLSRTLSVPGRGLDDGVDRSWHLLDTGDALDELGVDPVGTILAVHGNPTWSYLWRSVIASSLERARAGGPAWRVIAVDQLEMGWSERTGTNRMLAQRILDLTAFTDAVQLRHPVISLGHDWGGVISLGWATEHPDLLAGVVLLDTAVHQPEGVAIPAPLRLAGARGVLQGGSVATTAFLDTTLALAHPRLPDDVRAAYREPYGSAARRRGIGAFVADIPADAAHPSRARLDRLAADVARLTVPALLLWGPRDPIFGDRYLDDLVTRMPHADVHRFEGAGHLVIDDAPVAPAILDWLGAAPAARPPRASTGEGSTPLWRRLEERREDRSDAVVEVSSRHPESLRRVSWHRLADRVDRLAAGLHRLGVRPGDRVSLLVTPGATLTAAVYACLRIGAVVVVADRGLGVRGLTRAVRGAWPRWVIGETRGLAAARALGWPGIRISTARLPRPSARLLGVSHALADLVDGPAAGLPAEPGPDDPAAVLYTSGSTGPAKGVLYTHRQLARLRDALAVRFDLTSESALATGFPPFALLGPALGARTSTPDMDVAAPGSLTATAVAAAVRAVDADVVFLSPAAILNVVETRDELDDAQRRALAGVRTAVSTGAPVSERLLGRLSTVLPSATGHAVYGMTECLLVSDVTLDELRGAASRGDEEDEGVCVGGPLDGVDVAIAPLDADGRATLPPTTEPGTLGEIVVSAPHLKERYDRLWLTDWEAERDEGIGGRHHRTGDVGHLDDDGRLWVEGRTGHVLVTERGPVAPVGPEQRIERVAGVRRAAVVGVGPRGVQQVVAVVEPDAGPARARLAAPELAARVRAAAGLPIAAVLVVRALPTDIRHNSKIDRTALAAWAERILAGRRVTEP